LVNYISLKFLDDADKAIRKLSSKVHFDSDIIMINYNVSEYNYLYYGEFDDNIDTDLLNAYFDTISVNSLKTKKLNQEKNLIK